MNAIETEHLTKRFRLLRSYRDLALYPWRRSERLAVEDLSLAIGEGELFGLLGENGAGKTTLIRMLSTTLLPSEGRARVAGIDVVRDPQAVRRRIGVVTGDDRTFYWRLTGRQNLEYFASLYHVAANRVRPRVDELLRTTGLTDAADRSFNTYSAGMRQKLAIARGLLTDPQVLFLDEPTSSLDPIAADEIRAHVVDHVVGELGRTVLLATHTLSEAEAVCHRVGIIRSGRLVALGTMDELREGLTLPTALDLVLEAAPDARAEALATRLRSIEGVLSATVVGEGERTRLHAELRAPRGVLDPVLRAVVEAGVPVHAAETRPPTLDEVYRAVHAGEPGAAA